MSAEIIESTALVQGSDPRNSESSVWHCSAADKLQELGETCDVPFLLQQ